MPPIGHAYGKQQCAASFNWFVHLQLRRLENFVCEHGSDSPRTRLFGCRLHRGRMFSANQVVQVVDYLFSVIESPVYLQTVRNQTASAEKIHSRRSKRTIKSRLEKERILFLEPPKVSPPRQDARLLKASEVFAQLLRDNGDVCCW